MPMIFLLAIDTISFEDAHCIHDSIQSKMGIPFNPIFDLRMPIQLSNGRQPIRIVFDLGQITENLDSKMCTKAGQVVNWSQGTFTCKSSDIMTSEKLNALTGTFAALNKFLTRMLNVTRLTSPITTASLQDITITPTQVNADLHITAVSRPFGESSVMAAAFFHQTSSLDGRPITGGIYINPYFIPSSAQNESLPNRRFFATLLHEVCHVLGISASAFPRWINPETLLPYGGSGPITTYTNPKFPNKVFSVITSKVSHWWATSRFNSTTFYSSNPSGIEIEDGGGSGTAGSHPDGRAYFNELMVGMMVEPTRISDLTFSLLSDSGWYDVDFSYAEPLPWGNAESYGESKSVKLAANAPYESFPEHYYCNETKTGLQCSYDYRSISSCISSVVATCSSSDNSTFCRSQEFYNSKNFSVRGTQEIFDYMLTRNPAQNGFCFDESQNTAVNAGYGQNYSEDSMCALSNLYSDTSKTYHKRPQCHRMTCDGKGILSIWIGDQIKDCTKEGDELSFTGYSGTVICPNPKHICSMKQFLKISPVTPPYKSSSWSITEIAAVSASCAVMLIGLIGIVTYYVNRRHKIKKMKEHHVGATPLLIENDAPGNSI